jgi:hypothetical protein
MRQRFPCLYFLWENFVLFIYLFIYLNCKWVFTRWQWYYNKTQHTNTVTHITQNNTPHSNTAHKTTQTIKDTLHKMNTMQSWCKLRICCTHVSVRKYTLRTVLNERRRRKYFVLRGMKYTDNLEYMYTWRDNKVRELIAVKVLHTSLLNITVVAFKVCTDASA